jgi:hypothetical protein
MAEKYYPDFYLRKRERDSRYRRYSSLVIGCVLVAVVGGVLGYLGYVHLLQPSRLPQTAADLADEKRDLEQEQLLGSGSTPAAEAPVSDDSALDPSGEPGIDDLSDVEYSPSMAGVTVEVEGGSVDDGSVDSAGEAAPGGGATESVADGGDEGGEEAPTPPAEQAGEDTFSPETESSGAAPSGESAAPDAPADQGRDADTDVGDGSDDAAESADDGSATDGPVFKVYAGSFSSRESAETAKADLSKLGLQGTIIEMELEHLLHVATLDSYESAEALQAKLVASGFASAFATLKRH